MLERRLRLLEQRIAQLEQRQAPRDGQVIGQTEHGDTVYAVGPQPTDKSMAQALARVLDPSGRT